MTAEDETKARYIIRGGAQGRERLRVLARINRASTLNVLHDAGIRPGMVCLDVGCGGGDVAFDLARLVAPGGKVLAMDIDDVKIDIGRGEASSQQIDNIEFRVADLDACDLAPQFDLVHARFILTHLPRPANMLAKVWGALRPGGVVVVADTNFGGYFSQPESRALRRYVELYSQTLKSRGGDANIGLRLPALLTQGRFDKVQMRVVQHAATTGDEKLITPMTMESIADAVVAEGFAARAEVDAIVSELYEFARDPTTVLSGPRIVQAWGYRAA